LGQSREIGKEKKVGVAKTPGTPKRKAVFCSLGPSIKRPTTVMLLDVRKKGCKKEARKNFGGRGKRG